MVILFILLSSDGLFRGVISAPTHGTRTLTKPPNSSATGRRFAQSIPG